MPNPKKRVTRREFIKEFATVVGGAMMVGMCKPTVLADQNPADGGTTIYLPVVTSQPTPTYSIGDGKVVHARDPHAINLNGGTNFYQKVVQDPVSAMTLASLQELTGQTGWPAIWHTLFARVKPSGYSAGEKIAIKVNLNNSSGNGSDCSSHNNNIDATPQPIVALLVGLTAAGVNPADVIVFDTTRTEPTSAAGRIIPSYMINTIGAAYPGVKFVGRSGCNGVTGAAYGKHSSLTVNFASPKGTIQPRQLADVLYDATYLINMPILKGHGANIPFTLAFKNHFGSISYVMTGAAQDSLHNYIEVTNSYYSSQYSTLVEIYKNTNIAQKTILTVGDGLFGAPDALYGALTNWSYFNGPAASLFFSADPVAVECVMGDIIRAEGWPASNAAYDHLFLAQDAGLGICEGTRSSPGNHNPKTTAYSKINYTRLNL